MLKGKRPLKAYVHEGLFPFNFHLYRMTFVDNRLGFLYARVTLL